MNRNKVLAVTSTSIMAAGVAHGAIIHSNVNIVLEPGGFPSRYDIDLDQDGVQPDFRVWFDDGQGDKPLVDNRAIHAEGYPQNFYTLSNTKNQGGDNPDLWGAPLTLFGETIDAGYAAENPPQHTANLFREFNDNIVGDWPGNALTDGYVGLIIVDTNANTTNFGYVNLIYDARPSNFEDRTVTVVRFAYNDVAAEKIFAGATSVVTAPVIYTPPASKTVGFGDSAAFTVQALADPAPSHQWMAGAVGSGVYTNLTDNGHFSGTTMDTLNIDAVLPSDELDYVVVLSNAFGVVTSSPPATLTGNAGALAGPYPAEAEIFRGQDIGFTIEKLSGTALSYQWRKDGGNITGATNATLVLPNLSGSEDGSYDVYMVTPYGDVFSTNSATLTTVATNGGDFEAEVLANSPDNYYRLNETEDPFFGAVTVYDNVGAKNGVMNTPVRNGNAFDQIAGPRPSDGFPGLASTNWAVQTIPGDPAGSVVLQPWDLNTNAVTISAWIKPLSEPSDGAAIVGTRDNVSTNDHAIQFHSGLFAPPPYALGYNWNDDFGAWTWNSGLFPPLNEWSFIALVVTPTNATMYLLNNDELSSATHTLNHQVAAWDLPVHIGNDPDNNEGNRIFDGMIDEVAVFKRSLSQAELVGMYFEARGISGLPALVDEDPADLILLEGQTARFSATVKGTEPVTRQWKQDGAHLTDGGNISGATSDTLTIANVIGADAGSYAIGVTNAYGSDLSASATLSVEAPNGDYQSQLLSLAAAAGLNVYYPLNETENPAGNPTAYDFARGLNGVYEANVLNAHSNIAGPRPADGFPGFPTDNAAAQFLRTNDNSWVSLPPLTLGTNAATLTAWIYPAGTQVEGAGVLSTRGGFGDVGGLVYSVGSNVLGVPNLGFNWNDNAAAWDWNSGIVPPSNQWSFVSVVVTPTNGTLYVFNTNETLTASTTLVNGVMTWGSPTFIGTDDFGEAGERNFDGVIDEVAVFTGALSTAQLQSLYNAAAGIVTIEISIEKVGSQIQLSWPSGTLEEADTVLGPWSANPNGSPYLLSPTEPQKYYRVAQ